MLRLILTNTSARFKLSADFCYVLLLLKFLSWNVCMRLEGAWLERGMNFFVDVIQQLCRNVAVQASLQS